MHQHSSWHAQNEARRYNQQYIYETNRKHRNRSPDTDSEDKFQAEWPSQR